jgi:hypothetical protein
MKTFAEYLTESKHTYNYRIKIAGDVDAKLMSEFKEKLEQFDVVSMTAPKKTPVQKQLTDFPQYNNESMTFMDVVFNYPATPPQITQIVQLLGIDPNRVIMQDLKYADSVDQERATQESENKNLLSDTDYPAPNKEQKALSKDYATGPYDHAVVKNAYKSDFTVAGGKTPPAVTSNEFPMGNKSAIGTTKNKLPVVQSNAR